MRVAWEPLPAEKLFIIGVIEAFNRRVSPRLANGDENRLDPIMQTQSDHKTKRARMFIAATKA